MKTFKDTYRFDMVPTANHGFGFGNEKIGYPKFDRADGRWADDLFRTERTPLRIPKRREEEPPSRSR